MRAARNPPPRLTNMDFCKFIALWIPAFAGMTVKNRRRGNDPSQPNVGRPNH